MPGPDDDTSCGGGVRCPTSCSSSGRGSTTPSSALVLPEKLLESRRVEHSCGVYGVFSQSEGASRLAFFALYALNHRGQESAGIASFSTSGIQVHKGMGLVSQVFDEGTISTLSGKHAIGHTRYSTSGGSQLAGAQPFVLETDLGQLAIAHNGQVARTAALRALVLKRGVGLFTNSDSEIIAQMLARPQEVQDARAYMDEQPLGINVHTNAPIPRRQHSSSVSSTSSASSGGGGGVAVTGPPGTPTSSGSTVAGLRSAPGGGGSTHNPSPPQSPSTVKTSVPLWSAWVARMAAFMADCEGAYSLVALTKHAVFGIRDPNGLRPLCIGEHTSPDGLKTYHLSSESCALATVGAKLLREVLPGEIVMLDGDGIRSWRPLSCPPIPLAARMPPPPPSTTFCIFEYVYFARPDSKLEGRHVHSARTRLGAQLAKESPPLATHPCDLVAGVPDSSVAAAIGYANHLRLPFSEVFCKNRYIGRTFIKPHDALRKNAIQLKYNPLPDVLAGKSIILVDDSLVRGNTLRQLVPLLRSAGAREVHVRISSPPIRHPCYYGVDIGSYDELIATHVHTVEGLRDYIGADSLAYLSYEGLVAAVEGVDEPGTAPGHCSGCFTGKYPIEFDLPIASGGGGGEEGTLFYAPGVEANPTPDR